MKVYELPRTVLGMFRTALAGATQALQQDPVTPGVWLVWSFGCDGPMIRAFHTDELSAHRDCKPLYERVSWLPLSEADVQKALKAA